MGLFNGFVFLVPHVPEFDYNKETFLQLLFKRYRFEFKSQNLWVEIKLVLERIENLQLLAVCLQQTLSPDPNARRPGKCYINLI